MHPLQPVLLPRMQAVEHIMWLVSICFATAVTCWDGSFFRYRFNPLASDGKFCTRESYDVFLDIGDDVL